MSEIWRSPWIVAIGLNTVLAIVSFLLPKKLLTPAGVLHGWCLGVLIWGILNWPGYVVVMFYFLVGSAVTRVGIVAKEAAGIAEKRSGARGPENVWGSALTATLCTLLIPAIHAPSPLAAMLVEHPGLIPRLSALLCLAYVASFSTKLADTCASEIGKAYGQRTFLITTFQPVPRGTEGAVSLEGTLAGVVAALAIATVAYWVRLILPLDIALCTIAAFVAINLESVIGATLQNRWPWLTNEVVNVINTTIGAIVAVILAVLL